jgi:hypothetical protein
MDLQGQLVGQRRHENTHVGSWVNRVRRESLIWLRKVWSVFRQSLPSLWDIRFLSSTADSCLICSSQPSLNEEKGTYSLILAGG